MIYLTTGANGAGKTLLTLQDVRNQQLKENRPVYYHGFTALQPIIDFGWLPFDPKKWQDLPDGSICVMDECQNEFPARKGGDTPDYITAIAQDRRKRGFDFWMIAPHPMLVDVFIRRPVSTPSWHRHLKRAFGADMVSVLQWSTPNAECEKPAAGDSGVVTMRAYPKEVYGWYRSASLHTGKKRIPKAVWMLGACALLVPAFGYFAITGVYGNVTKHAKPAMQNETATPAQAPLQQIQQPVQSNRKLTADEYVTERVARLADFPHTAPAYDDVTKPTEAPYPAACVQMGKTCKCYTQQATLLQVSGAVCLQIVAQGFFMDWKSSKGEYSPKDRYQQPVQQQQGQQVAQADPVRSVPVPMPAARSEPPQNQYLQGLAARNAQVRSSLN